MTRLGVNIDHVATLRQARQENDPDPIAAALLCEKAGADSIVCHLREDRRHIQDRDVRNLKRVLTKPLNLELSLNTDIVKFACRIKPYQATLVPEKRQEITTEGGLDVAKNFSRTKRAVDMLRNKGILTSLFIAPVKKHITLSWEAGAEMIELHTGRYDHLPKASAKKELQRIKEATIFARKIGLRVSAGHGLKYHNVKPIARIPHMEELNIGHSIISYAVTIGLPKAVREMKKLLR